MTIICSRRVGVANCVWEGGEKRTIILKADFEKSYKIRHETGECYECDFLIEKTFLFNVGIIFSTNSKTNHKTKDIMIWYIKVYKRGEVGLVQENWDKWRGKVRLVGKSE